MAYTLGSKCAKNLCKRIVLLQLIIKNVVTFFLEHMCRCTTRNRPLCKGTTSDYTDAFRPIFAPLTFSDLISSFDARGY